MRNTFECGNTLTTYENIFITMEWFSIYYLFLNLFFKTVVFESKI